MKRQRGAIPVIHADRYPSRFVVFDTEAFRGEAVKGVELQTLRVGVGRYVDLRGGGVGQGDGYYTFTTVEGLGSWLEYLTRKDTTLFVYAHNLKYDLQLTGLLTWLVGEGWRASLFVVEDPPTFIKLKRGRMSLTFVDTFNYWQTSVEAMGRQLGLVKLVMPPQAASQDDWVTYCKRDVDVLTEYLLKFIDFLQVNDLCGLGLTLASQAFRSYRHRFMQSEIVLHDDPLVLKLERDGYFGGRVEAFHIGRPPASLFYKLDVNSMYPYVMRAQPYPVELVSYSERLPVGKLSGLLGSYYCLADVSLNVSAPAYAVNNGVKLIFPVGQFRTVLHQGELSDAYERGEVRAVERIAIYKQAEVFTGYVDFFYNLKLEAERSGDLISRHQSKIMLNSLYGKFGQRQVISKIVPTEGVIRYDRITGYSEALGRSVEINYLGNSIEIRYKEGEAYYSSPAIAGGVTSWARRHLWGLIRQAGLSNVYYCDTDCVVANPTGYERLKAHLDPTLLGALKVEGVEEYFEIRTAKDYTFGSEVKVKGVPKSAVKLSDNTWKYEQFRGAKTWINQGMPTGVEVYERTKQRLHAYDKGVVMLDGSVLPLRLGG